MPTFEELSVAYESAVDDYNFAAAAMNEALEARDAACPHTVTEAVTEQSPGSYYEPPYSTTYHRCVLCGVRVAEPE